MTILIGPIDTTPEAQAILKVLREESWLSREPTNGEIGSFLQRLRQRNIIDGIVDTPREIELLLNMLRETKMLCGPTGPINTEEVKIFMEKIFIPKLQEYGLLQVIANARQENISDHSSKNKLS